MTDKNYFGKALESLLKERGRGAESNLALELGVSQGQINKIKTGKSTGSIEMLEKISEHFGKTYHQMIEDGKALFGIYNQETTPVSKRNIYIKQGVLETFPELGECVDVLNTISDHGGKKDLMQTTIKSYLGKYIENNDKGGSTCGAHG